jgi:hypothetical protein
MFRAARGRAVSREASSLRIAAMAAMFPPGLRPLGLRVDTEDMQ